MVRVSDTWVDMLSEQVDTCMGRRPDTWQHLRVTNTGQFVAAHRCSDLPPGGAVTSGTTSEGAASKPPDTLLQIQPTRHGQAHLALVPAHQHPRDSPSPATVAAAGKHTRSRLAGTGSVWRPRDLLSWFLSCQHQRLLLLMDTSQPSVSHWNPPQLYTFEIKCY